MKLSTKLGLGALVSGASLSTFAADHSAAITAATDAAQTSVTAVVGGVIAIAAIATGVGIIVSMLRR